MPMRRPTATLLLLSAFWLTGCDLLGIEPASAIAARREAEGKAVGAACRHAGRAIEDCYLLNKRSDKSAVYSGWREMNDYMTENKIEVVRPDALAGAEVAGKSVDEDSEPAAKKAAKADKPDKSDKAAKSHGG